MSKHEAAVAILTKAVEDFRNAAALNRAYAKRAEAETYYSVDMTRSRNQRIETALWHAAEYEKKASKLREAIQVLT